MSILDNQLKIFKQKQTFSIDDYEYSIDNLKLINDDIIENGDKYSEISKMSRRIISIIEILIKNIENSDDSKIHKRIFAIILVLFKNVFYQKIESQHNQSIPPKIPHVIESPSIPKQQPQPQTSMIHKEINTSRLTNVSGSYFNKIFNPNITKAELDILNTEINTSIRDPKLKKSMIQEIKKQKERIEIVEKITNEIKLLNTIKYNNNININTINYDISNIDSIKKMQMETCKIKPNININSTIFDNYSILNFGLLPKLMSIMLDPEIFCGIFYNRPDTNLNDKQTSYNYVIDILDAIFILSYKNIGNELQQFNKIYKSTIIRDTHICKSLLIQNIILYRNSYFKEQNVDDKNLNFNNKIITKILNKKINDIKNDENKYIFNYTLLNNYTTYLHNNNDKIMSCSYKTFNKTDNNYEYYIEAYYYYDQIKQSLKNINKINSMLNEHENYINDNYNRLMKSSALVLTYVKERNDAGSIFTNDDNDNQLSLTTTNPRYTIFLNDTDFLTSKSIEDKNVEEINYYDFKIKYFNYPTELGYTIGSKNPYNHKKATEIVNDKENEHYFETYNLGKINRYYSNTIKSEQIAKDPECGLILLNKLRKFENIIIVGNGQSGSGKTAALLGFDDIYNINQPGLLPELSKQLIDPSPSDESKTTQYFNSATVKFINLYLNLDDTDDINDFNRTKYKVSNIQLYENDTTNKVTYNNSKDEVIEYTFEINNGEWKCNTNCSKKDKTLDNIINEAFKIRETEPTKNNPDSSRSHIVACVTFEGISIIPNDNNELKKARIVVCDLAGVEDKFTCKLDELLILNDNYENKSQKYAKQTTPQNIYYNEYFCDTEYKPTKLIQLKNDDINNIIKYIIIYNDMIKKNNSNYIKYIDDIFKNIDTIPFNKNDDEIFNEYIKTLSDNINIKYILSRLTKNDEIQISQSQYNIDIKYDSFNTCNTNEFKTIKGSIMNNFKLDNTFFNINNDINTNKQTILSNLQTEIYYEPNINTTLFKMKYNIDDLTQHINNYETTLANLTKQQTQFKNDTIYDNITIDNFDDASSLLNNNYTILTNILKNNVVFTTLYNKFIDFYKTIELNINLIKEIKNININLEDEIIINQTNDNSDIKNLKKNIQDLKTDVQNKIKDNNSIIEDNKKKIENYTPLNDNEGDTDEDKKQTFILNKNIYINNKIYNTLKTYISSTKLDSLRPNTKDTKSETLVLEFTFIPTLELLPYNIEKEENYIDKKKYETIKNEYTQGFKDILSEYTKYLNLYAYSTTEENKSIVYNIEFLDNFTKLNIKFPNNLTTIQKTIKKKEPKNKQLIYIIITNINNKFDLLSKQYDEVKTQKIELYKKKIETKIKEYENKSTGKDTLETDINEKKNIVIQKYFDIINTNLNNMINENDKINQYIDTKIEEENNNINNLISEYIINLKQKYYDDLLIYKNKYIDDIKQKYIKIYLPRKIDKIKKNIQHYIRLSQLEFNCNIRKKEGFMINTSLKEMQKFIGSILFDSAKERFNKVLIKNNLLKMDDKKMYIYNDYIKYNDKIIEIMDKIIKNMNLLNNDDVIYKDNIIKNIFKDINIVKIEVLQYFMYISSTYYVYKENYTDFTYNDFNGLLIYIYLIDIIIIIFINDQIDFRYIYNALMHIDDLPEYKKSFENFYNETNSNQSPSDTDSLVESLFNINNLSNIKINILSLYKNYISKKKIIDKLNYINDIFKKFFNNSKDNTCTNIDNIIVDDKIQYTNENYKKIVLDLSNLWDVFKTYIINKKKEFNNIISSTIGDTKKFPSPLLYFPPSINECVKNINKHDNEYEKFYTNTTNKPRESEILFNIMTKYNDEKNNVKGFELNMSISTIVLFTVINITPHPEQQINNPPNPPFININKLKLIYKIISISGLGKNFINQSGKEFDSIHNNITIICNKYLEKLNLYNFYKQYINNKSYIYNVLKNGYTEIIKDVKKFKNEVIDFIDSINATTLIGTVDFEKFTKIRDPEETYFICDDKSDSVLLKLENIIKISQQLEQAIQEDNASKAVKQSVTEPPNPSTTEPPNPPNPPNPPA